MYASRKRYKKPVFKPYVPFRRRSVSQGFKRKRSASTALSKFKFKPRRRYVRRVFKKTYQKPFMFGSQKQYRGFKSFGRGATVGSGKPMVYHGPRAVTVCHKEYLCDVITSAEQPAYDNLGQWLLNPGNPETFPWLSLIANQFEEYEFKYLKFIYRSTSVDAMNTTNTALGVVIGCVDYNATHGAFTSKQQMDNFEGCISGKPSLSWTYNVICSPKHNAQTRLYVTNSTLTPPASSPDPRLYYLGAFQLATQGFQADSVNVGELWVDYCVDLHIPAISPGNLINYVPGFYYAACSTSNTVPLAGMTYQRCNGTQTATTFNYLGVAYSSPLLQNSANNILCIASNAGNGLTVLSPNVVPGTYLQVTYFCTSSTIGVSTADGNLQAVSGCTRVPYAVNPTIWGSVSSEHNSGDTSGENIATNSYFWTFSNLFLVTAVNPSISMVNNNSWLAGGGAGPSAWTPTSVGWQVIALPLMGGATGV